MQKPRYIPADYQEVPAPEGVDAVVYAAGVFAIGYSGKRSRRDFHYQFGSVKERDEYVSDYYAKVASIQETKRRQAQIARDYRHPFVVGDIVYNSWGWEQTNVDFYEVVATTAKTVTLRQISRRMVRQSQDMAGFVIPVPGAYLDNEPPLTKTPRPGEWVNFEFGAGGRWDGEPMYTSWYG